MLGVQGTVFRSMLTLRMHTLITGVRRAHVHISPGPSRAAAEPVLTRNGPGTRAPDSREATQAPRPPDQPALPLATPRRQASRDSGGWPLWLRLPGRSLVGRGGAWLGRCAPRAAVAEKAERLRRRRASGRAGRVSASAAAGAGAGRAALAVGGHGGLCRGARALLSPAEPRSAAVCGVPGLQAGPRPRRLSVTRRAPQRAHRSPGARVSPPVPGACPPHGAALLPDPEVGRDATGDGSGAGAAAGGGARCARGRREAGQPSEVQGSRWRGMRGARPRLAVVA
ncbi:hypothetical protein NN561_011018 [Cricetulus griseus]